jgi:hypothetical protein
MPLTQARAEIDILFHANSMAEEHLTIINILLRKYEFKVIAQRT